jgi:DNA-binding MarR family transcriptional regulator
MEPTGAAQAHRAGDGGGRTFPPLGMVANRLNKSLEAEFFRRLAKAGHSVLRMPHTMLLERLPPDGARLSVLASLLGMSQQAAGEIVDDLESAGYVQRIADPADRRAKLVVTRPKGAAAFGEVYAVLSAMDEDFASIVGSQRYDDARSAIVQLIIHLERG